MMEYKSPGLLDIFTKIVVENKNYCYVCLRNEDERRLVVPVAVPKFLSSVKATKNDPILFVCHICEKQAANALKVLRATTFASTVSLILNGMKKRELQSNRIMFNKRFYSKILRNSDLSENLTPLKVYEELQYVRKYTSLVETETLIMDGLQAYDRGAVVLEPNQTEEAPQEIYDDAIIECPIRPVEANSPVPNVENNMPSNPAADSCVVIDDEDSSQGITQPKDPQPTPTPILPTPLTQPKILSNNLVVTQNPSKIVTVEELLGQPHCPNVNFILHPIYLDGNGNFTIPSMSGYIINGNLIICEDQSIRSQSPLGVDMEIVRKSLLMKNDVFLQNFIVDDVLKGIDVPKANCQSEESCQPKKMKMVGRNGRNGDLVGKVSSRKGGVCVHGKRKAKVKTLMKCIKISDISSGVGALTTDGNRNLVDRTDWEDKIPMDVISFVDAVDPNASSVLLGMQNLTSLPTKEAPPIPKPVPMPPMQVGPARSLKTNPIEAEIIDLC